MEKRIKYVPEGRKSHHLFHCSSAIALLLSIPAFILLSSCTPLESIPLKENMKIRLRGNLSRAGLFREADIFVYNDDRLKRLDSYQRVCPGQDGIATAASRKGDKIIAVIVNPQEKEYEWNEISSLEALLAMEFSLKEEQEDYPSMSGICHSSSGESTELELIPLVSEITVRSIRCDFRGKPYRGCTLDDCRAYLTNVNSIAGIFQYRGFNPSAPINTDGSDLESGMTMAEPKLLSRDLHDRIGEERIYTATSLFCYPNDNSDDSAGSPFTRLVITGKINGERYYYPISINREGSGADGVGRHCRYVYDLTIRGAGSTDPDIPIERHVVDIQCERMPWTEMGNADVAF